MPIKTIFMVGAMALLAGCTSNPSTIRDLAPGAMDEVYARGVSGGTNGGPRPELIGVTPNVGYVPDIGFPEMTEPRSMIIYIKPQQSTDGYTARLGVVIKTIIKPVTFREIENANTTIPFGLAASQPGEEKLDGTPGGPVQMPTRLPADYVDAIRNGIDQAVQATWTEGGPKVQAPASGNGK